MADSIEEFSLDYSKKYPKLYDDSMGVFKQKILDGIKERGAYHHNDAEFLNNIYACYQSRTAKISLVFLLFHWLIYRQYMLCI